MSIREQDLPANPEALAEHLLTRAVFCRRDEPGYERMLQRLQQGIQRELARLWAESPLCSPGHRLVEGERDHQR